LAPHAYPPPGRAFFRRFARRYRDRQNRRSVLGTYSLDRYGDTTQRSYGVFAIRRGNLVYRQRVRPTSR